MASIAGSANCLSFAGSSTNDGFAIFCTDSDAHIVTHKTQQYQRQCQKQHLLSKNTYSPPCCRRVRIRGTGGRRNVRLSYAAENSSVFRCALKVVMVAEFFICWSHRVPDSWCHDSEYFALLPVDRVGLVVDWRISEYELVDDNEASHVDKLVVLFSEFYMWSERFCKQHVV